MEGYGAHTYGEARAADYDLEMLLTGRSPAAAVRMLAGLAGDGPALELGIGTGRVALPLAATGVEVHGVEISPSMIAALHAKEGGDRIVVIEGDMRDAPAPRNDYRLVYIVYNTLCQLLSQDDQVACLIAAAGRLAPGGAFVVETMLVDPYEFTKDQRVRVRGIGLDEVIIAPARHDRHRQVIESATVTVGRGGTRVEPLVLRYPHPSELDLMARLAGLIREARYEDWHGTPLRSGSENQISVFRKPATA